MGSSGVDQLGILDDLLGEIYREVAPRRLLVLGCGTGNGFRHFDPAVTSRVVGVDINGAYLEIARERYPELAGIFEPHCCYAEKCDFDAGSFDLIHSALLLEYLDPAPMVEKIASWLAPGGTWLVVLQEPSSENGPVSHTGHESLMSLAEVMRLLSPEMLGRLARRSGLEEVWTRRVALKRGKHFFIGRYRAGGQGASEP